MMIFNTITEPDARYQGDVLKLYESYADMVYRLAFVRTRHPADADDIFQEVFIRLVKHVHKLKSEEHAKAWLLRCTINCCNSHHQSSWQQKTVALAEHEGHDHIDFQKIALLDALQSLTPEHQDVLHLFYYEGYSNKEIATLLGIKENTVKSRLRRARYELRDVWEEEDGDAVE